jgi:predicted flap endonuclease-1-like 5' DNA nuclease
VEQVDDPNGPAGRPGPPRPAEERLTAALEALAARDRVLAERGRRLTALEDVADHLAAARARVDALSDELAALRRARRADLAERDHRIAQLESLLAEGRRDARTRWRTPDDLKRIKGIGPVIEGLLHDQGITTFRQIATLSAEDRQRVGRLLGAFHGRIERDRWIEQAAELTGHRRVGPTEYPAARPLDTATSAGRYNA